MFFVDAVPRDTAACGTVYPPGATRALQFEKPVSIESPNYVFFFRAMHTADLGAAGERALAARCPRPVGAMLAMPAMPAVPLLPLRPGVGGPEGPQGGDPSAPFSSRCFFARVFPSLSSPAPLPFASARECDSRPLPLPPPPCALWQWW